MPTSTARFVVVKIPGANHRFVTPSPAADPHLKVQVRAVVLVPVEIVQVVVIEFI